MTGREIDIEQEYLLVLYARVDAMREDAATRLAAVRHAGEDRDAAAVWQAEVDRLDAVEQGLCFGRLDLSDGRRVYLGRLGLFRDEDEEPLLVDWRAPAARAVGRRSSGLDGSWSASGKSSVDARGWAASGAASTGLAVREVARAGSGPPPPSWGASATSPSSVS